MLRPEPVDGACNSDEKRGCDCCDAFAATDQPEAVGGSRRKTDGSANRFAHHLLRLSTPRPKPGTLPYQLDGNVGDVKAGRSYPGSSFGKKGST